MGFMPRRVVVNAGPSGYLQNISVGPHLLLADEPIESGSNDAGPNPYELLLAALGACTSMTVRMYAERKRWPIHGAEVRLSYARTHFEDCAECDTGKSMTDRIEMAISLTGDLSEDQRRRLIEIANNCPVHSTLVSGIQIHSAGDTQD